MLKESKNFEVEAELYNKADVVLKGLGSSMSEAITEYLEQVIKKNSIQSQLASTEKLFVDEAEEAYLKWF